MFDVLCVLKWPVRLRLFYGLNMVRCMIGNIESVFIYIKYGPICATHRPRPNLLSHALTSQPDYWMITTFASLPQIQIFMLNTSNITLIITLIS